MTPLLRCVLTVIGILIAGIPLVYLTLPQNKDIHNQQASPHTQQEQQTRLTFLSLRYTGTPTSGILRYEDTVLGEIPEGAVSPYEMYVELPHQMKAIDIEVELHWPKGTPENAVTLTLEPQGLPARTETQWTGSLGDLLHTIFSLSW